MLTQTLETTGLPVMYLIYTYTWNTHIRIRIKCVKLFLFSGTIQYWKKINISQVFVVVLILRDHLLQKEDEDRRETAVFQEEPSRTVFSPHINLLREYIQVLSQFHKITVQEKKNCDCWAISYYNMTSYSCIIPHTKK